MNRLPAGFRTNADDSLACAHRDVSVCTSCASRDDVVDVYGAHYYVPDAADRAHLAASLAGRRRRRVRRRAQRWTPVT